MAGKGKKPVIRFKGFTDDYEERNWKDTVEISTNMVDPKIGVFNDLLHIGPGNIESFTGKILDNVQKVGDSNLISGKFHFNKGDVIYGKINPQLAKYVIAPFEGLASADSYVLNTKNGISQNFLYTILQTKDFYKYSVAVSSRTGMPKINRDELNVFNYLAPKFEEQLKIGDYFQNLDNLLTLQQRKLDKMINIKKSLLKKMFPKNGAVVPEIRFKGFSEDWEECELGEIAEKVSVGIATSSSKYFTDSIDGIPFIKNQDIKENRVNTKNIEYITKEFDETNKTKRVKFGDILTVRTGYPGLSAVVPSRLTGAQTFTTLITRLKKGRAIPEFIVIFINSDMGRYQINGMQAGGAQKNVNANILSKLVIQLPGIEEQKKIIQFFKTTDNLITHHQLKLEKIKNIKKACLEKMFV